LIACQFVQVVVDRVPADVESLGDAFPKQQVRLRVLIGQYREIGPAGTFGAAMIEATLAEADRAMASGDVVAMLRAYRAMEECQ